MSIGDHTNGYAYSTAYHISNAELEMLQTSGAIVLGSEVSSDNISDIMIDGAFASFMASSLAIASPHGSIVYFNESSSLSLLAENSSWISKASKNLTFNSNVSVSLTGSSASATLTADSDCSLDTDGYFVIGSYGSLLVDTVGQHVSVSATAVDVGGMLNVTSSESLQIEGEFHILIFIRTFYRRKSARLVLQG